MPNILEENAVRSMLDELLTDSRLYTQSKDYKALLDFVVRLRAFAPFNAMLLHLQKPGLSYAASAYDWRDRFGRTIKEGARPLLILWPFGPVALVYDVQDTEGAELPEDVASFTARGPIDAEQLKRMRALMDRKNIQSVEVDTGDAKAGSIRVVGRAGTDNEATMYRIQINRNHPPAVQFATLTHELAHLFLGHLGPNRRLKVPERLVRGPHEEIEAESVSYLVCKRNGVESKPHTYLANFVEANSTIERLDIYPIMRAAGQVEALLGLSAHTRF